MKKISTNEKILIYESFLHKLSLFFASSNSQGIKELIKNADRWSYILRSAEKEYKTEEIQHTINMVIRTLCDTPKTDGSLVKNEKRKIKKNNDL